MRTTEKRPGESPPTVPGPRRSAALVTLIYLVVATLWVLFAGRLMGAIPSQGLREALLASRDLVFVVLSATALFVGLRFGLGRRERGLRELRREHDRILRQVERSPLALIEFDSEFRVRRWSPAAESLFGWTAQEAEGRAWTRWDLVHPDEQEALERFLAGLGGRPPGGALLVHRNAHRNGEEIWCEWYLSWLRDASGSVRSILALVNDITPDREAMSRMQERNRDLEVRIARRTRELAAARRDLRAFTSSLANDLRQPVRAVIGFAEDLREGARGGLSDDARRQLVYLMAAGRQLDHLIEDLLEYARLGAGETVHEPVDLVQSARTAIRRLEDRFPEAISAVALPRSAVTIVADPELLERVLVNLFENSLQYRDPHRPSKVTIHVGWTENEVKVRVQDNGPGIPPEDRERVFRLFERLHSRESHPGSGMGLAIVRKAMDLMGGTVAVEEQTGPGTTFLLRFPTGGSSLEIAEGEGPPAQDEAAAGAGGRTGGETAGEEAPTPAGGAEDASTTPAG